MRSADEHDALTCAFIGLAQVRGWEGWTTESIELHLQTRFAQLETASALHRYTEGFRTVEDIYNILQISQARRKHNPDLPPPKAKLMATYYERLTTLFWVSENYLFHAFAWYKYYTLCREYNRSMSDEAKRMQASAVLLAALCIPQLPAERRSSKIGTTLQEDILRQKMGRMSTLLGFATRNPTRESLLAEIRSKNLIDQVPQYLRDLYVILESRSDPLVMVEQARPLLEQLKAEVGETVSPSDPPPSGPPATSDAAAAASAADSSLGRYVQPLTRVLLLKLVINLSTAYHTVSMDHLKSLTSGLNLSFEQVEKSIVLLTQTKTLSVRIDHRAGCLRFGSPDLESDSMRSQLTVLAQKLEAVHRQLVPPPPSNQKAKVFASVRVKVDQEHAAILERKILIEKRKEEAERMAQEKAKEEQRLKMEEEMRRRAEEDRRVAREQKLREQEKQRKIQQEMENREKKRFLAAMGKKADEISEEQIAQIDTEALQREHQEKIAKKREEAERKTREAAKKFDYLVRAIRIEELPLITQRYEEKVRQDRERYEQETLEKAENAKLQWEADVKDKALLQEHEVFAYLSAFEEKVMVGRKTLHETACAAAEEQAEVEAEKGKIARARKRKQDEAKRLAEEEARRQKEEEAAKLEEERRKREEAKRAREEKEEELKQAELQRMEEERRKKEAEQQTKASGKYVPPSRRNQGGGGGASSGPSRFSADSGPRYQGGGRYEGRSNNADGGGDIRGDSWRGGGWRGGAGAGGSEGDRDRGGTGDRRPYGGGAGDRDRRPGQGPRDDRGGHGRDDRDRNATTQNQRWR
jgi:translation initiation factor 3 subunit A